MSKEYIEIDILDVMSVMEGSYPDANQRWDELKKLIELQKRQPTQRAADGACMCDKPNVLRDIVDRCLICGLPITPRR